jgi:hypothetical protein
MCAFSIQIYKVLFFFFVFLKIQYATNFTTPLGSFSHALHINLGGGYDTTTE